MDVEEDEEEEELGGRCLRFHCAASSSDDLGVAVVETAFRGFLSLSFAARTLAAAFVALIIFLLLVMVMMAKGRWERDKSLKVPVNDPEDVDVVDGDRKRKMEEKVSQKGVTTGVTTLDGTVSFYRVELLVVRLRC
jgi:hypothetical protein